MNSDIQMKKTENVKGINIGDFLFFVTMFFVVGFPAPSIFKAISIVTFFIYTFLKTFCIFFPIYIQPFFYTKRRYTYIPSLSITSK